MVYKSLILSLTLTLLLGYALTAGLTHPSSPLKKLPDWTAFPLLAVFFLLYLLAAGWAIKGFGEHRLTALFSLGCCALGLGAYALGLAMEWGHGNARPGQYDYDFSRLDPQEKAALTRLLTGAGLTPEQATFSEHWRLAEPAPGFRICVQKGRVTGLQLTGRKIADLSPLTQFPQLGDLYLRAAGLTDMRALRSERLERLDLSDNQIADLRTLAGCPNLRWLILQNNQLQSEAGLALFTKLVSHDLSGNPLAR